MATTQEVTVAIGSNKVTLKFSYGQSCRIEGNKAIYTPYITVSKNSEWLGQYVYFSGTVKTDNFNIPIYSYSTKPYRYFHTSQINRGSSNPTKLYTFDDIEYSLTENGEQEICFALNLNVPLNFLNYKQTATANVNITHTLSHSKSLFHHVFYDSDDEVIQDSYESTSFNAPEYSIDDYYDSKTYNINWQKVIDSKIRNSDNSNWINKGTATTTSSNEETTTITYSNLGFASSGCGHVSCGGSISGDKLKADRTWKADYNESEKIVNATVGSLESNAELEGYTFKGWYTGTDFATKVTTSRKLSSDTTFYGKMVNNEYYVTFDISSGDEGQTEPKKVTKTYARECTLPELNITRNGYKQIGWVCEDFPDNICTTVIPYNLDFSTGAEKAANSETITMIPVWEVVERDINYNYYTSAGLTKDVTKFTIEDYEGTTEKGNPNKSYSSSDSIVFLGWCTEKPTGWDDCSGVYSNVDKIDKTVFFPESFTFDPEDEWVASESVERYGIWTCTGKYIYLSDGWHKINVAYVKTENGWKACENFWVETANGWKHEKDNNNT